MLIILLVIQLCLLNCYFMFRNNKVYSLRTGMLELINYAVQEDIKAGREWEWRYKEFRKVSYWKMLYSFKDLNIVTYYKNPSFLVNNDT